MKTSSTEDSATPPSRSKPMEKLVNTARVKVSTRRIETAPKSAMT